MLKRLSNSIFRAIYQLLRFQNYIPKSSSLNVHPAARIYGSRLDGKISVGEGSSISRSELYGKIEIGRFTSINGPNVDLYANQGKIIIGNFCSIARNVTFQLANHKMTGITTYNIQKNLFNSEVDLEEESKGNIVIGHDVWIGTHVVILPGARIGTGAVIAANAVVNSEIPPYAVVGGTPAKVLRYRFDQRVIDRILSLEWWKWDIDKIERNAHLFAAPVKSINELDQIYDNPA